MQAEEEQRPAWPPAYGQRSRQQQPQNMPMSLHAAASMRAHAALSGKPWLGDGPSAGRAAQCPALPDLALQDLQNPFAGNAPGAYGAQPLPGDCLSVLPGKQVPSDFEQYLQSLPADGGAWCNGTGPGLPHMGSKAEGRRPLRIMPPRAHACALRCFPHVHARYAVLA